jgi:hypothetical protein
VATRWTTAEDQPLRQPEKLRVEQIAGRLARSPDAGVARRRALGIASRHQSRPWLPLEEALLGAGTATGLPAPLLAQRPLNRTSPRRRRELVAPPPPARPYLAHEDKAIRVCVAERGELVALARRLGRLPDAVRVHAQQLGIHSPPPRRRWADWEDALIRDGYTSALGCAQIARQLPHRSAAQRGERGRPRPQARCGHLRLPLENPGRPASGAADRPRGHARERGTAARPYPEALRRRAARLGARPPRPAPAPRHARHWTSNEDELLRLHQPLNPARLAELLGRSDAAVCRRLCSLGLRASAQRSPHHPVRRRDGLPTPGERAVIERELPHATRVGA